jgi:parallel beta-helix repeat protein
MSSYTRYVAILLFLLLLDKNCLVRSQIEPVVAPPVAPPPPVIIYPELYFTLYPKSQIVIGSNANADVKADVNDSYMAFNKTLEYLEFIGGGNIVIQEGVYLLDRQISLLPKMKFRGAGKDKTILKLKNNAAFFLEATGNQGLIRASQANNIIISDMTLDGNKVNQISSNVDIVDKRGASGISTIGCQSVDILNVKVVNFEGYGIVPRGYVSGNIYGKRLNIENCETEGNGLDGFNIYMYRNVTLRNNTALANYRHGFSISYDTQYIVLRNNRAINNGYLYPNSTGCGVKIQDKNNETSVKSTSNVALISNLLYNSSAGGICTDTVSYLQILSNSILLSSQCMNFENSTFTYVSNNLCIKTASSLRKDILSQVIEVNTTYSQSMLNQPPLYITAGFEGKVDILLQRDTDVAPALQGALDAIGFNGGGTLELKEGKFIVDRFLQLSSNTALIGQGMYKTIIYLKDRSSPFIIGTKKTSGVVTSYTSSNLVVANLTINGNKENQLRDELHAYGKFGFFIQACENTYVDGVRVTNFQGYGFDPHGWKNARIWSKNLTIVNCLSDDNDWDGYTLDQTDVITIVNSTARNNGRHGFNVVTGSKYVNISNCTAEDNGYYYPSNPKAGGCGFIAQNGMNFGTGYVIFENNIVRNSTRGGICGNDVYEIDYNNNIVSNTSSCMNFAELDRSIVRNTLCNQTNVYMLLKDMSNTQMVNNTWIKPPEQATSSSSKVTFSLMTVLIMSLASLLIM